jgi:hypothetical protein
VALGRDSDWRCPPAYTAQGDLTTSDRKLGWLREAIGEGEQFLKTQRAFMDMDRALDVIAGVSPSDSRQARTLSGLRINRAKRNVREIVSTLSNLRPMWGYKNDNKLYDSHSVVLNKLVNSWWHNTFADRRIRQALQYAMVMGTGYISPVWKRDFWNAGRGDIFLNVYGPRDVLFVQLPSNHDIQGAYAVIIRIRTPIHVACAMWPTLADKFAPTYVASGALRRGMGRVTGFVTPILRRLGGGQNRREEDDTPFPMLDIFHTYIMDPSINLGPDPIVMGEPDTNFSYEVPVYQSEVETTQRDPKTGQRLMRKVSRDEAMLYPARRLLIACPECNLEISDGPSPWWHRKVPVIGFTPDDWPWEVCGYSPLRDMAPIQGGVNSLIRAVDDAANARLRPNVWYDANVLAKSVMDDLDFRQGGQSIPAPLGITGEPIKAILDPRWYTVDSYIPEFVKFLYEQMDHVSGVRDMTAIAKARQIPASESIDKLMEMMGPLVQDISRGMEAGMRDLGEMVKALFFQFYNAPRRVQILGEKDGLVEEDYDYEPASMLPSHVLGESTDTASPTPLWQRARWHMDNFVFHVTPQSLHQITQMSRKLLYLQLFRQGGTPFPMDPWTLGKELDIDIGKEPPATKDIISRWIEWRKVIQQMMPQGQPGQAGRKPSGGAAPHLVNKGGRQTVAESR